MAVLPSCARIADLLKPFTTGMVISPTLYEQIHAYLDVLLRWNARTNLTAVRDPEQMVTRHFGESLFAAATLFGATEPRGLSLADVGSGAGFPGLPIKLAFPSLRVTLIESQNKKATFLREAIRMLDQENVEVFLGRAEAWPGMADVVTLRAVESFTSSVTAVARLVLPGGRLCLLIGDTQTPIASEAAGEEFRWEVGKDIPSSERRRVIVGNKANITPSPD